MQFPRKPFLDRVIVEVTPLEKFFEQNPTAYTPLDDERVKYRSDRGIVCAVGDGVAMAGVFIEMPVQVGDEVFFDPDTAYAGRLYLLPSDQLRKDLPEYLELYVGDLLGRSLRVGEMEELKPLELTRGQGPTVEYVVCSKCGGKRLPDNIVDRDNLICKFCVPAAEVLQ
jgi:co-chaperonin GroES (HSP10)